MHYDPPQLQPAPMRDRTGRIGDEMNRLAQRIKTLKRLQKWRRQLRELSRLRRKH